MINLNNEQIWILVSIALTSIIVFQLVIDKNRDIYDDRFKQDLILEQRIACIHGCRIYPETSNIIEKIGYNFHQCVSMCEEKYKP